MKHVIIYLIILASVFNGTQTVQADEDEPIACRDIRCLGNMEFQATKLDKGRTFIVKSDHNLSDFTYNGTEINFVSPQKESIFYRKDPSKVIFHGKVEKTHKPKMAGKSGSVKIKLDKITIDKVTYPVQAIISKMDNKSVRMGTLAGSSIYLTNLAAVANEGTIDSSLKDPCYNHGCLSNSNYTRPLLFLGGAALQAADLLISPIASLFKTGKNIAIPENTYFEIKLDKELYVLNI